MERSVDGGWLRTRAEIVRAIRSGRIDAKAVMEELGVSGSVVGGWCSAEDRRGRARSSKPVRFAELSLVGPAPTGPAPMLVSLRGGRRLRVACGFDAAELVRLVRALESC